jgi:translation initiation factor 2A
MTLQYFKGTHLLILCSTETSANSYYGDTSLHYMNANGDSLIVTLSKKGPIYSLEWNPVREEFIVIYGTMPAKSTLFNNKCEAIFDFGTGARNECYFNPLGNIVCLCGFGNIRGRIEVWNLGTANKAPEQICSIAADDTTSFEWCPDSEHILTATTAPRLRVSNGHVLYFV